jgi:uncharacterized OB-fold protein
MTCSKCAARMYRTSLNYESNGKENFAVLNNIDYYKCPTCGHLHFPNTQSRGRSFVRGQKIKGVMPEEEL